MARTLFFLSALASLLGLASCGEWCDETCGIIDNDGIDGECYWLVIRNDCSGNRKQFCVDEDVWLESFVGDDFCVIDADPW